MKPHVTLHNTVSADARINGFPTDTMLHGKVLSSLRPNAVLVGSRAAWNEATGTSAVAEEDEQDRQPRDLEADDRPLWTIVDSRGKLHGVMHMLRRADRCREVVPIISTSTPSEYRDYLEARGYPVIVTGRERADLPAALHELGDRFGVKRLVATSGGDLAAALLHEAQVDELSLLVAPHLVGADGNGLTQRLPSRVDLERPRIVQIGNAIHLRYAISGPR